MPNSSYYIEINLNDLIQNGEEVNIKNLLSSFSCPKNLDVENFLKSKAIEFSQRGFAQTHLVFWASHDKKEIEFVGYYALAPKYFSVSKKSPISNTAYKHLIQHGIYDNVTKKYNISSILIGQLGKNYSAGNDTLISGDELLRLAINKIIEIQKQIGGRYTYLECEDVEELRDFFTRNGFIEFGQRKLDKDETNINGKYLLQYLKKI